MKMLNEMPDPMDFPIAQQVSTNYFMVSAHHDLSDLQVEYLANSLKQISNKI